MRRLRARGVRRRRRRTGAPGPGEGAERLVAEGVEVHLEWRPGARAPARRSARCASGPRSSRRILTRAAAGVAGRRVLDAAAASLRRRAVARARPDVVLDRARLGRELASPPAGGRPARADAPEPHAGATTRPARGSRGGARRAALRARGARAGCASTGAHLAALRPADRDVGAGRRGRRQRSSARAAVAVPNGVDTTRCGPRRRPPTRPPVLLYTGTMSYPPNAEGLALAAGRDLAADPRRAAGRRARRWSGKDPPADAVSAADERVTLTGWVPDIAP